MHKFIWMILINFSRFDRVVIYVHRVEHKSDTVSR
jgi:hypothetical protein